MTDVTAHLRGLVGQTIPTLTGTPNRILEIRGNKVIVGTSKSPEGQPVPIQWVQNAVDELLAKGELQVNVKTVGYRSAFIGAVLTTLPGAIGLTRPARVRLTSSKRGGKYKVTMQTCSADIVSEVGRLLKEERILRGLSLEEAAKRANLSPEHLCEVEAGFPKPTGGSVRGPTLGKLERVANVYRLRVGLVR